MFRFKQVRAEGAEPIPTACITVEDAEIMQSYSDQGKYRLLPKLVHLL